MKFNWLEGFSIATKVYFRLGHLDIKENVVTKGGFPIGAWLQWCRDNVEKLSLFEINDLCNYGMIWNKESLGNHKDFNKNLERLKKYGRTYIINIDNIEEEDLKEWAMSLFNLRRMCDDAFLTLREIEMLTEAGFDWGPNWAERSTEVRQRKDKVNYLLEKIHAYKSNKTLPGDTHDKQVKCGGNVANSSGFDEYSVLSKAYVRQYADKDAIYIYKMKMVQLSDLSTREVRLLKTLNDGRAGIAKVFVPCVNTEYTIPFLIALKELEVYQEIMGIMNGSCWCKLDVSLNGYSIIFLVCRVLLEIEVNIKLEDVRAFEIDMKKNNQLVNDILLPYTSINYKDRNILRFIQKIFRLDNPNETLLFEVRKFVDKFRRVQTRDIKYENDYREMKEKKGLKLQELKNKQHERIQSLASTRKEQKKALDVERKKALDVERKKALDVEQKKALDVEQGSTKSSVIEQEENVIDLDGKIGIDGKIDGRKRELDSAITNKKTFDGLSRRYKNRCKLYKKYLWQEEDAPEEKELLSRLWSLKDYLRMEQKDKLADAGFIYYDGEVTHEIRKLQVLFYSVNKALTEYRTLYVKNTEIPKAIKEYKSEKDVEKKDLMLTGIYRMVCRDIEEFEALSDLISQLESEPRYKYACDMITKVIKNRIVKKKIEIIG